MEQETYFFEYIGELGCYNHTTDNSILICERKYEYDNYLKQHGYTFMGFSLKYNYRQSDEEIAFVFQDEDGETLWIHFPILSLSNFIAEPLSIDKDGERVCDFLRTLGYQANDSLTCKILHYSR